MKLKKSISGEAFNFSSKDIFSVLQLIKSAESAMHRHILYEIKNTARNEIPYQHLKDNKIREIGWKSSGTFIEKIRKICFWYSEYFSE
jgi:nucleoside-diphosphate-sugar epimerase